MKAFISKGIAFAITFGVILLLILYVTGNLPVFVSYSRPYLVAGTIPIDPGSLRWEIEEEGFFLPEAAHISYSTGTTGNELIQLYTESMPNYGWLRIDEEYSNTHLYEFYTWTYKREYAGEIYYARIPLKIHKSSGDVSDDQITISKQRE